MPNQSHQENAMKRTSNLFAGAAVFALASLIAGAQNAPTGPYKQVTEAEYNQAVQSGQAIVISPAIQAQQQRQQQITDAQNLAVVEAFIRQNPDLAGLDALAAAPTDPSTVPTADGNYMIQVPDAGGDTQTLETLGTSAGLAALADSIQASSDPARQLALYQSVYSQYGALYHRLCANAASCTDLVDPSKLTPPSSLQNASLGSIKGALKALGSLGDTILKHAPVILPTSGGPFAACSTEIGASIKATNGSSKGMTPKQMVFGDQTDSSCSTPSKIGILGNFNWLNENLLTCVKKQGSRGTCHIFAATSAMEELIARDTGDYVNLSEQDFQEHEKLLWSPNSSEGGPPQVDLDDAQKNSYHFAYENQWDYNPSYGRDNDSPNFTKSCVHYPYPSLEPGCSDTIPQAPEECYNQSFGWTCYYYPAPLSGPRSPYMSNGAKSIWDSDPDLLVGNILIQLAFNNAVILAFDTTDDFSNASSNNGYVAYNAKQDALGVTGKGRHAVHVVGYIDNDTLHAKEATESAPAGSGGGYFIIKNSWGTCSGDVGYYYMPVDYLTNRAVHVDAVQSESH
jgi:C1A family cysteine protease